MKRALSIILVLALMLSMIPLFSSAYAESSGTWKQNSKGWWYQNADGSYPKDCWKQIDGKWYHFDANGYMQTGWLKLGDNWYYLNPGGSMATGWKQIDGKWYHFSVAGVMQTGWRLIDDQWYYFKDSGAMAVGWVQISGSWYYFSASGKMQTGWRTIDGKTYFFKSSGIMAANEWCQGYWLNANGTWTYKYKASWKKDSKGWWYEDTNGWYPRNTRVKIDGKDYKFNSSGYWIDGVNIKPDVKLPTSITLNVPYYEASPSASNAYTMEAWLEEKTGVDVDTCYDTANNGYNLVKKLLNSEADGSQLMVFDTSSLTSYCQEIWSDDPTDESKFRIVSGMIQPYPYTGVMLMTYADNPYSSFDELEAYIKANPGQVTVADRPGSIITTKLKAFFNQRGLSDSVTWLTTTSAEMPVHLLANNINIVPFEEASAVKYLNDSTCKVKAIINLRINNDYSCYPDDLEGLDTIKKVPTLLDVFGKDDANKYYVPNISVIVAKAGTSDDLIDYLRDEIDALGDAEVSTDEGSFYLRQRINGGTSKYYSFSEDEVRAEWKRILPLIREIVSTPEQ